MLLMLSLHSTGRRSADRHTFDPAVESYMADGNWNELAQAEARAHRRGQQRQVSVFYLNAPGSFDEILWPRLMKQKLSTASIIDAQEGGVSGGEAAGGDAAAQATAGGTADGDGSGAGPCAEGEDALAGAAVGPSTRAGDAAAAVADEAGGRQPARREKKRRRIVSMVSHQQVEDKDEEAEGGDGHAGGGGGGGGVRGKAAASTDADGDESEGEGVGGEGGLHSNELDGLFEATAASGEAASRAVAEAAARVEAEKAAQEEAGGGGEAGFWPSPWSGRVYLYKIEKEAEEEGREAVVEEPVVQDAAMEDEQQKEEEEGASSSEEEELPRFEPPTVVVVDLDDDDSCGEVEGGGDDAVDVEAVSTDAHGAGEQVSVGGSGAMPSADAPLAADALPVDPPPPPHHFLTASVQTSSLADELLEGRSHLHGEAFKTYARQLDAFQLQWRGLTSGQRSALCELSGRQWRPLRLPLSEELERAARAVQRAAGFSTRRYAERREYEASGEDALTIEWRTTKTKEPKRWSVQPHPIAAKAHPTTPFGWLCIYCKGERDVSGRLCEPESPFCSYGCAESYQLRVGNAQLGRKLAFERDKGICNREYLGPEPEPLAAAC